MLVFVVTSSTLVPGNVVRAFKAYLLRVIGRFRGFFSFGVKRRIRGYRKSIYQVPSAEHQKHSRCRSRNRNHSSLNSGRLLSVKLVFPGGFLRDFGRGRGGRVIVELFKPCFDGFDMFFRHRHGIVCIYKLLLCHSSPSFNASLSSFRACASRRYTLFSLIPIAAAISLTGISS